MRAIDDRRQVRARSYLLVQRENLIGAMFTGRKYVAPEMQLSSAKASAWLAAVIVVAVARLIAAVANSA